MVMFILNIENVIIKKDLTKFIYENNYKRIGRTRTESDYLLKNKKKVLIKYTNKLIKKIADHSKFKKHYRLFFEKTKIRKLPNH